MKNRMDRRSKEAMSLGFIMLSSLWVFLALLSPRSAEAVAPGSLDTSFDTDGKVTTDFGGTFPLYHDCAYAVALQPDGKILAGGSTGQCGGSGDNFALARYNADGSLDTTFGTGGKVTTDFIGTRDEIHSLAIQSDGKIVAVGFTVVSGSNYDFAIARYNTNGSLDTAFGTGGKVTTEFQSGDFAEALGVVIQGNGKIVGGGETAIGNYSKYAMARYNTGGGLDTTFNGTGKVISDFGYGNGQIWNAVALQGDNKIVAAGLANISVGNPDFAVARYNSDGSLDTAFGSGGLVTTNIGSPLSVDIAYAMTIQYDGKIILAGASGSSGHYDFALARYNSNGTLDTTFDTDGKVTTDFGSINDIAHAVILQGDGKIVAAGQTGDAFPAVVFGLARYNSNGSLDSTFGAGGKVTTLFGGYDIAGGVAIQWDGKLVAAGLSYKGSNYDFALARYWLVPCP